jgi:hypothetical protein
LYNATALTAPNNLQPVVEGLDNNGQVLIWNPFALAGAPTYLLYNPQAGGTITALATNDSSMQENQFAAKNISGNGTMVGFLGHISHNGTTIDAGSQPVLSRGGQYSQYTTLPGWGQAVNDSGQVAYQSGQNAYIVTNGKATNLGTVPGYDNTTVWGINNSRQAAAEVGHVPTGGGKPVGKPAFYNGQQLIPLGNFGGPNGYAVAINNKGDLTGAAMNSSGLFIGFVSHNGGPLVSLGTLPGSWESQPASINDRGQIVGQALGLTVAIPPGATAPIQGGAFLYQNGVLNDLNKLLSPSASNITLFDVFAVNNASQIVAEGFYKNVPWPQLFLLTPEGQPIPPSPTSLIQTVPEPSTLAIFGFAFVGGLALVMRNRGSSRQESPS